MDKVFKALNTDGTSELVFGRDIKDATKRCGRNNSFSAVLECIEINYLPDSEKIIYLSGAPVTNTKFVEKFREYASLNVGQIAEIMIYGRLYSYRVKNKNATCVEFEIVNELEKCKAI